MLQEEHICISCGINLPFTLYENREVNPMADRFNALIQKELQDQVREPYAFATALLHFEEGSAYNHIPYQLKYEGNIPLGKFFGTMLGKRIAKSAHLQDVDTIIPVPLHRLRRFRRGYNQAEIIAKEVASCLPGATMRTDILQRPKRTSTQTQLNIEQKHTNVMGAFAINKKAIKGNVSTEGIRHILVIDDVFTTGSTTYECFKTLRTVFGTQVRISIASLCFVG